MLACLVYPSLPTASHFASARAREVSVIHQQTSRGGTRWGVVVSLARSAGIRFHELCELALDLDFVSVVPPHPSRVEP
jgi:hypothetical protein